LPAQAGSGLSLTDWRTRTMAYLIGLVLAAAVCGAARLAGFDRERVFYPTMLIVIASYYILFAVMGGDGGALLPELAGAAVFSGVAVAGFRSNLWLVVAALAGHGIFDFVHDRFFSNDGVPGWWPGFCLAFDIAAALFLGALLSKRPRFAFNRGAGGEHSRP
jgi:hypothetical protein